MKLFLFQYVGAALGLGGVGYMAKNFKNKPKDMKLSVYLIHTRLLAQGTVIGEKIQCEKLEKETILDFVYFQASSLWACCIKCMDSFQRSTIGNPWPLYSHTFRTSRF